MTFEEFFKRKKIDLVALQQQEAGLFAEFENHYGQMGEKSFDHTKKYWFNQLRRRFPAAPEVKVEKIHIENTLAEQTITDQLTETPTEPSVGFKPRFKPGMGSKPAESVTPPNVEPVAPVDQQKDNGPAPQAAEAPKVGFKPRFKAGMVAKPAEEKITEEEPIKPVANSDATATIPETPADAPKVGFKPRFNAAMVAKKTEAAPEEKKVPELPAEKAEELPPVGFKPRFNAATMAKKTEPVVEPEKQPELVEKDEPILAAEAPEIGFKPRFKASMVAKKPEQAPEDEAKKEE